MQYAYCCLNNGIKLRCYDKNTRQASESEKNAELILEVDGTRKNEAATNFNEVHIIFIDCIISIHWIEKMGATKCFRTRIGLCRRSSSRKSNSLFEFE